MTPDRNRQLWHRIWDIVLVYTLLITSYLCIVPDRPCNADSPDRPRRILIIPSYNFDYKGIQWFLQGAMAAFTEQKPFKVIFFLENLQLATHPSDRRYMDTMAASLKIKYSLEKPDLIIVQYKQALQFMELYGKDVFGDVPVVFAGLSVEGYLPEKLSRNYTGIVAAFSAKKNIELILQNHPDVKKIYVVAGSSPVEHNLVQEAINEGALYRGKVEFIALNDLTFPALLEKLGKIEDKSAIMYQAFQLDAAGKVFVPAQAAIEIASAARAPVYGLLDTYMGSGITGGFLIHHEGLGRRAAEIAMQWLQTGVMPDTRVKSEQIGSYRFDWRQLLRWGIREGTLPSGSRIEFKASSVWDSYKKEILGSIFLILLQAALIIGLLWNRYERIKTEKELRKSEERFRATFERSTVGKSLTSPDGKLLRINQTLADMLGYTIEEMLYLNYAQITHPDDVAQTREYIGSLLANEQITYRFEKRFIHKKGDIVWADLSSTLLRDDHGKPLYLITSIVDITGRKQAEDALLKSEERLRGIIFSIVDWVWEVDENGVYTYSSQKSLDLLGESSEGIVGKTPFDFMPPDEAKRVAVIFSGIVANKAPIKDLENWNIRKNGERICLLTNGLPILDEEGNLKGYRGVDKDITEHKRAEETLKNESSMRAALLDNIPGCIALILRKGTHEIVASNKVARDVGAVPGQTCFKTCAMRDDNCPFCLAPTMWDTDQLQRLEVEYRERWYEGIWAPLSEDLYVHYIYDITERKKAEKQLQDTLESLRKAVGTTIQVMVSAVETRDPYTAGHQTRSADLARAIAMEIGLPQDKIDSIRMAGSIHDIGKLSIPAEILSKPTKLSEIEFSLIKEHARKGYEMLKDVESPWPLAEIVYQHHERMDGSGYPRNLKGDDILIEARILTVSDVVEAMASHRPYRPGLGIDAALNEIENNRGILYDNTVADACLRLFREKGFQLAVA